MQCSDHHRSLVCFLKTLKWHRKQTIKHEWFVLRIRNCWAVCDLQGQEKWPNRRKTILSYLWIYDEARLADTQWTEIVKKSGPVGELNLGPLVDVRSRTLPLHHTDSQLSMSQDFITISDVLSDQHNTVLEIFQDGL